MRESKLRSAAKPEVKARKKAYAQAHPEQAQASGARWRAAHPEQHKARNERWRKANTDRWNEIAAARRARLRGARVEHVDRAAIYERDGGICHICGKKARRDKFDLDHLIPLSKGGEHSALNLAVSHPFCNRSRGAGRIPAQLRLLG